MCGIFGLLDARSATRPDFERWGASLRHRGPDDRGVLVEESGDRVCALGHTRLSIIDLSPAGHQPMESSDGRYVIVFNGEIYNFRALRAELESLGERFRSHSDTEVLLVAFHRWREQSLAKLRGMFAFAIWDRQRRALFLARDRLGVKPLYVARTPSGGVAFASEVRSLLDSGVVARRLSREAVSSFLAYGSVYEPHTIVEGVDALSPGSWREITPEGERSGSYYELPVAAPISLPPEELRERLRVTLADAVRLRLEADVPVGVFLSGGVDSAVVACLAAKASGPRLHTFTVTFDEAAWDESEGARALAAQLGTEHHEARLVTSEIADHIEDAVAALDQPSADGVNTFFVSRAARQAGLAVALSGIGGDELFAGYASFRRFARAWRLSPVLRHVPRRLRRGVTALERAPRIPIRARKLLAASSAGGDAGAMYAQSRAMFLPGQRARLMAGHDAGPQLDDALCSRVNDALAAGRVDPIDGYGALELAHYMRCTLLRDTDVMSMAHSLEVREPLLDHELIDLALRVPGHLKFRAGQGNKPLLTAAVPEVPQRARMSPKKGFTLPFDRWMRTTLRPWVEARLLGESAPWLDRQEVARLWTGYLAGSSEVTWARMWALSALADYCRRHRLQA